MLANVEPPEAAEPLPQALPSFEQRLAEAQPTILYHAHRFAAMFGNAHLDDFLQEAAIGVWVAYQKFDPAKGKFAVLCNWWIRSRVTDWAKYKIRTVYCDPRIHGAKMASFVSLDTPLSDTSIDTWADVLVTEDECSRAQADRSISLEAIRAAVAQLNPKHRVVIEGIFFQHKSGAELGRELGGLNREAIRQRKERAFTALRSTLRNMKEHFDSK